MSDSEHTPGPPRPYLAAAQLLLVAALGALSAWRIHERLHWTDATLTGWAIGGGATAGIAAELGLRRLLGSRRMTVRQTYLWAALVPLLGGTTLVVYQWWAFGAADPAWFPDWLTIAVWGFIVGALPTVGCRLLLGHGCAPDGCVVAVVGLGVWCIVPGGLGYWLLSQRAEFRPPSCSDHAKQLALGMRMYVQDWDDRLPPPTATCINLSGAPWGNRHGGAPNEYRARWDPGEWDRRGGELLGFYIPSYRWFCPQDPTWRDRCRRPRRTIFPDPGVSYRWNARLGGKRLNGITHPHSTPIFFDRAPLHDGGRTVAFVDGHVKWLSEGSFRALPTTPR